MARVDPELSNKIKVLSLCASVAVVFNHAYNLDASYAEAGAVLTGADFTENFVKGRGGGSDGPGRAPPEAQSPRV